MALPGSTVWCGLLPTSKMAGAGALHPYYKKAQRWVRSEGYMNDLTPFMA